MCRVVSSLSGTGAAGEVGTCCRCDEAATSISRWFGVRWFSCEPCALVSAQHGAGPGDDIQGARIEHRLDHKQLKRTGHGINLW